MDHRQKMFKSKFNDAARQLGVAQDQVVSLKIRDIVSSYSEYHDLLRMLENESDMKWRQINETKGSAPFF